MQQRHGCHQLSDVMHHTATDAHDGAVKTTCLPHQEHGQKTQRESGDRVCECHRVSEHEADEEDAEEADHQRRQRTDRVEADHRHDVRKAQLHARHADIDRDHGLNVAQHHRKRQQHPI